MWDDFGLGEHAKALQSFITGHTYLVPGMFGGNRICLGGMDVTHCDWLLEQNSTSNREKPEYRVKDHLKDESGGFI